MELPKALLLDLDNTCYAYNPCHRAAIRACSVWSKKNLGLSPGRFLTLYNEARKDVHRRLRGLAASHHRLLYFQGVLERLRGRTDGPASLALYELYWTTFIGAMKAAPGLLDFLTFLKKKGIRCLIVSDLNADTQMRKMRRLGIHRHIDFLVTSEEAGVEKPGSAIFRLALAKARCRPRDVWMVGDDVKRDMDGARKMNIFPVHFDNEKVFLKLKEMLTNEPMG